ncbi:hypothetical protein ACH0B6_19410 [Solibacillus silvestris]
MTSFDIIGFFGTALSTCYVTLYLSDNFGWLIAFLFDELEDNVSTGYVDGDELII